MKSKESISIKRIVIKDITIGLIACIPVALLSTLLIQFFGGVILGFDLDFVSTLRVSYLAIYGALVLWDVVTGFGLYIITTRWSKKWETEYNKALLAIKTYKALKEPDVHEWSPEDFQEFYYIKVVASVIADSLTKSRRS